MTVASVADGSPAARAGMKADDRILSVAGVAVPPGPDAAVIVEGGINAYADGENVIIPWAMMRFANDDELRVIVAHEIAHNAMGHIEAKRRNAAWGALFGALADVAMATQGVNTGAQHTAEFMKLGAQAYSQDFEREADYVGMYVLARAGVDTGVRARRLAPLRPDRSSGRELIPMGHRNGIELFLGSTSYT